MTWFSLISKPLSFVITLPILLDNYSTNEIALWYLFSLFISMQLLADFGFYNTFIRVIGYAYSGSTSLKKIINIKSANTASNNLTPLQPNFSLMKNIIGVMNTTYLFLCIIILVVYLILSVVIKSNITNVENVRSAWIGWIFIIAFTIINFYSRIYSNYLLGLNKVADVKKIEGITSFLSLISTTIAALLRLDLGWLVFANQVWFIPNLFILRRKANNNDIPLMKLNNYRFEKRIFLDIWEPAWKSGVSTFASFGVTNLTGIIYSKMSNSADLAEYLLALKFINVIRSFSQAPFYSKIPKLNYLISSGKFKEWENVAQKNMFYGSIFFVVLTICLAIIGPFIFQYLPGEINFPQSDLWALLVLGNFLHRIGGMHSQFYMTTHDVKSHISDLISGTIYLLTSIFLLNTFDVYSFPIGMIIAYSAFYVPYSLYFTSKNISTSLIKFEIRANLFPFIILLVYLILKII